MKYLFICIAFLGIGLLTSCDKAYTDALVERNCTGTYVKMGEDYFAVCNADVLTEYTHGSAVDIQYKKLSDCTAYLDDVICMMYFHHEGYVEITKIK